MPRYTLADCIWNIKANIKSMEKRGIDCEGSLGTSVLDYLRQLQDIKAKEIFDRPTNNDNPETPFGESLDSGEEL